MTCETRPAPDGQAWVCQRTDCDGVHHYFRLYLSVVAVGGQ